MFRQPTQVKVKEHSKVKLVRILRDPFKVADLKPHVKAELNKQLIDFAANSTWSDWKRDIMGGATFFPARKTLAQVYDVMNEFVWCSWSISVPADQLEHLFLATHYRHLFKFTEAYAVTNSNGTKLVMRWNGMRSVNNREAWNFLNFETKLEPVWKWQSAHGRLLTQIGNGQIGEETYTYYPENHEYPSLDDLREHTAKFRAKNPKHNPKAQERKATTNARLQDMLGFEIEQQINVDLLRELLKAKPVEEPADIQGQYQILEEINEEFGFAQPEKEMKMKQSIENVDQSIEIVDQSGQEQQEMSMGKRVYSENMDSEIYRSEQGEAARKMQKIEQSNEEQPEEQPETKPAIRPETRPESVSKTEKKPEKKLGNVMQPNSAFDSKIQTLGHMWMNKHKPESKDETAKPKEETAKSKGKKGKSPNK